MVHQLPRAALAGMAFAVLTCAAVAAPGEEMDVARRITAAQVPLEKLPEAYRQKVAEVLEQPATVYTRGPAAAFPCKPAVYHWLVDHPHWGFRAWKALGSKCASLELKPDGSYLGTDGSGGEFRLHPVFQEPGRRIWYAEGSARPAPLTPAINVRAVLLLKYQEVTGIDGRVGIRQRAELFALADNKSAGVFGRLFGLSSNSVATRAVEQIDLFFSGMSWYISEHPKWARTTLQPTNATAPEETRQIELLFRQLDVP